MGVKRIVSVVLMVGVAAGISGTVLLYSLDLASWLRAGHAWLVFLLPVVGFFVGFLFDRFGKGVERGNHLVLDELHKPSKKLPVHMPFLVWIGTTLSHLAGASVGREGAVIQMSAALADRFSKFENEKERKAILASGMGAGFSAAIGAPIAGIFFGLEMLHGKRPKPFALLECAATSFVAFGITRALRAPHSHWPQVDAPVFSPAVLGAVAVVAVLSGAFSFAFIHVTHTIQSATKRLPAGLRGMAGGLILVPLFLWEGTHRFEGLGIGYIQSAFNVAPAFADPFLKFLFAVVSIGFGFKGGEFIPLVFMGATSASLVSVFLPVTPGFVAALGFGALFGAAAKAPLSCSLMICELFGWPLAPYAFAACFLAQAISGAKTIYPRKAI